YLFVVSQLRTPPISTLFPYTTLFRSSDAVLKNGPTSPPPTHVCSLSRPSTASPFCPTNRRPSVHSPNDGLRLFDMEQTWVGGGEDRKSTRLNSSHLVISYAVFCLKKK